MTRLELIGRLMMLGETFDLRAFQRERGLPIHVETKFYNFLEDKLIRRVAEGPRRTGIYSLTPKAIELFRRGTES